MVDGDFRPLAHNPSAITQKGIFLTDDILPYPRMMRFCPQSIYYHQERYFLTDDIIPYPGMVAFIVAKNMFYMNLHVSYPKQLKEINPCIA